MLIVQLLRQMCTGSLFILNATLLHGLPPWIGLATPRRKSAQLTTLHIRIASDQSRL